MKVKPWAPQFLLFGRELGVEFFGGIELCRSPPPHLWIAPWLAFSLRFSGLCMSHLETHVIVPQNLMPEHESGRGWGSRGLASMGASEKSVTDLTKSNAIRKVTSGSRGHLLIPAEPRGFFILYKLKVSGDIFYCPQIIKREQSWDKSISRVMAMGNGPKWLCSLYCNQILAHFVLGMNLFGINSRWRESWERQKVHFRLCPRGPLWLSFSWSVFLCYFCSGLDCNIAHRIKRKRGTFFAFLLLPRHPTKCLWGSAPKELWGRCSQQISQSKQQTPHILSLVTGREHQKIPKKKAGWIYGPTFQGKPVLKSCLLRCWWKPAPSSEVRLKIFCSPPCAPEIQSTAALFLKAHWALLNKERLLLDMILKICCLSSELGCWYPGRSFSVRINRPGS